MQNKYIIKATGEREEFNSQNFCLQNVQKLVLEIIEKVLTKVQEELKNGTSTKDIYTALFLLKKEAKPVNKLLLKKSYIGFRTNWFSF